MHSPQVRHFGLPQTGANVESVILIKQIDLDGFLQIERNFIEEDFKLALLFDEH